MKKQFWLGCMAVLSFSGCNHMTALQPNAVGVKTVNQVPATGCHALKHLAVSVKNGADTAYRTHEEIQQDQLNQLKNATAQLGGNVFMLEAHHTTYQQVSLTNSRGTNTQINTAKVDSTMVDRHAMMGDAYACDATALAGMTQNMSAQQAAQYSDAQ
jgi:hypothetical protein